MFTKLRAYYFLIGFFCIFINVIWSQDQRVADSLSLIYKEGNLDGKAKIELLIKLSYNERNDFQKSLKYADELIALSHEAEDYKSLSNGYLLKGGAHRQLGNLESALEALLKSAEVAIKSESLDNEGAAYISIADVYSIIENYNNAEIYYNKAIVSLRKINDSIGLASALLNAGDTYFTNKKYDAALQNFEESGLIFKKVNFLIGTAYNLGNVGMVYAEQGKDALAERNIREAIKILEEFQDYSPISVYLTYMSDIYLRKNDFRKALSYAKRGLKLAQKHELKKEIGDANLKLSQLYDKIGNQAKAYNHYKDHIVYRDSVKNIEAVQQQANLETQYQVAQNQIKSDYEISQKQTEVDLLSQQKKNQRIVVIATAIALLLIGLLAIGLFRRNKFIQRTKKIIEEEKDRSDNLLLNILPEETAKELKDSGMVKAKKFESVTVLFTDFKGFTQYSENLSPEALVETIGFYFSKFDEIIEKYGLEKIKTIGDAYMCAGGLPFPTEDHAHKMVRAAFEIAEFVNDTKSNENESAKMFDIRIGINSGPVVAGVVGSKKFAYDIWGDTVNVASRMESMSEQGKINISENTYALIKEDFDCEYRGEIEAKNRGKLKMYFVNDTKV
jgi:class 3 adenylate cyclase